MPKEQSYRGLKVWDESMKLVEEVYRSTISFPADERYGLTAQMRRAAISIASNVAEGSERRQRGAFIHFLRIALGSQAELEVQAEIARRLGFLSQDEHRGLHERGERIGRMLNGLIASLRRLTVLGASSR